jgi:hypothetical protein
VNAIDDGALAAITGGGDFSWRAVRQNIVAGGAFGAATGATLGATAGGGVGALPGALVGGLVGGVIGAAGLGVTSAAAQKWLDPAIAEHVRERNKR